MPMPHGRRWPDHIVEVDIAGWYSFGNAAEHSYFPFRHVSGPLLGYTCDGRIDSSGRVDPDPGYRSLWCRKCGLVFQLAYPETASFEGAHFRAFMIAAYKHYTQSIFPHPDNMPFEWRGDGSYGLCIRDIDPGASPDFATAVNFLMRSFLHIADEGSQLLTSSASELEKTRKFFRNKKIERAREQMEKLLGWLKTPTPDYLRRDQ